MDSVVYIIGLVVVILYIAFGIDDLIWDVITSVKKLFCRAKDNIPLSELDSCPPKLIGIIIAAWHEDSVLGPVIDNVIASSHYPLSMYHIFLGVYPNDPETIAVAQDLAERHLNVHVIINAKPGPTCKADNVNHVLNRIHDFEVEHGWKFASITIHDSEDVVHPYEFKLTNYLIDRYPALQFPVFPLQPLPRLNNFFSNLTSGTYADEFAENHFRTMVLRDSSQAIVPSAGTGFVLSRKVLEYFRDAGEDIFPQDSLTEDYKLSLILAEKGFPLHYVLEKVQRLQNDGNLRWNFVATRSMFPSTFRAAVRQKTRWIYGITMQSFKFSDIFADNGLPFGARYSLYKDFKAKFGNLLVMPGYPVFIYFVLSLFFQLPIMYPKGSLSWWLCVVLTVMMLERQLLRGVAIKNVYGWRSVTVACLTPPIMPIRLVWGNIINMVATLSAWNQRLWGTSKKSSNKKPKWNKTDHEFLDSKVLQGYYRLLGDVLLEKELVDAETLRKSLERAHREKRLIGDVLLEENILAEEDLLRALANVRHTVFVTSVRYFISKSVISAFDEDTLNRLKALPILKAPDGYVVALCESSPLSTVDELEAICNTKVHVIYTTKAEIERALFNLNGVNDSPKCQRSHLYRLYISNQITWEQMLLGTVYQQIIGVSGRDMAEYMGLRSDALDTDVPHVEVPA